MSEPHSSPALVRGTALAASWPVVSLAGLAPDTLGNILASLGLLTLVSRRWGNIRGCWRNEQFLLLNGPADIEGLAVFLREVAQGRKWSNYDKAWAKTQKADTKNKNAVSTSLWCSQRAPEQVLSLFHSHIVAGDRLSFNPLFGSGGNAGRRDFAAGWNKAVAALASTKGKVPQQLAEDLLSFLGARPCTYLGDFSAGCWFSSANKTYNSGTKKPFREGQVTPWAMALASEAFSLLSGSTSRQLGSDRRNAGAFPFVTTAAAPESAGEAARSVGEIWLPVWTRPMSVAEVAALFSRGRAEVRGRAAITAPAFSAAILQRGVDAGIAEFRRFVLFHSTSENTFESSLASVVPIRDCGDALASAVNIALGLRDALPDDRKNYVGIRGPLDRAVIELAARPDAETARALVDALIGALRAVDRNRSHRKRKVRFQLLPHAWASSLVGEHDPVTPEINLAFALASLNPTNTAPPGRPKQITAPMLAYWLGAENQGNWWEISEGVPLRRVWGGGQFAANMVAVLQRRLIEERPDAAPPFDGRARVGLAEIEALLERSLDESELIRWFFRFSLFETHGAKRLERKQQLAASPQIAALSPTLALFALFKPLFDPRLIRHESVGASRYAKVGTLAHIAALLSRDDVNSAVQAARNAYHAVGVELADFDCQFDLQNSSSLLAALLVPTNSHEVAKVFRRWRSPAKLNQRKER